MDPRETAAAIEGPLQIGEWQVDPRADEISAGGRVIKLEPLRMRLLMALAEQPGQVVLSDELLDKVWRGAIVTPSSLYQSVAQLRQILGDSAEAPRYIATVPRKGYRLVAPVSRLPAPPEKAEPAAAAPQPGPPAGAPIAPDTTEPRLAAASFQRRKLMAGGVVAGVAIVAGGAWWLARPPAGAVRIAVLPFVDRSPARLSQAVANGLTDDVINALSRHPAMEVMTYDAVESFTSGSDSVREAAQRLDISFALLGEMWRTADRVRLSTRMLALPQRQIRFEETFEETIDGLLNLPQVIAARAINALNVGNPLPPLKKAAPSSAYEMYVLGMDALRSRTPESIELARRHFSQGIDIDATYARNHSGLGWSWIMQFEYGGGQVGWKEAYARAAPLYQRALVLDPTLVDAKLGLANVARGYGRFDEARRVYDAVIQGHPNNAQAHFGLALTEADDGWPKQALPHYERAVALNPTSWLLAVRSGLALMYLGRRAEAQASFERAMALDAQKPFGFYSLGILEWLGGRLDRAVAAYREALKRSDQVSYIWRDYAYVLTDLGLYAEAHKAFGRAGALLRTKNYMEVEAAWAWLAAGAVPPAPKALAENISSSAPWTRVMILAMAGEQPAASTVHSIDQEQSGYTTPTTSLYEIISGNFLTLDKASLFAAANASDRFAALLDEAEQALNRYEQRGVAAPALDFHRARVWALKGETNLALASLQKAVDQGWRRGWWLRLDPALASLRAESTFTFVIQRIEADLAGQRKTVAV